MGKYHPLETDIHCMCKDGACEIYSDQSFGIVLRHPYVVLMERTDWNGWIDWIDWIDLAIISVTTADEWCLNFSNSSVQAQRGVALVV